MQGVADVFFDVTFLTLFGNDADPISRQKPDVAVDGKLDITAAHAGEDAVHLFQVIGDLAKAASGQFRIGEHVTMNGETFLPGLEGAAGEAAQQPGTIGQLLGIADDDKAGPLMNAGGGMDHFRVGVGMKHTGEKKAGFLGDFFGKPMVFVSRQLLHFQGVGDVGMRRTGRGDGGGAEGSAAEQMVKNQQGDEAEGVGDAVSDDDLVGQFGVAADAADGIGGGGEGGGVVHQAAEQSGEQFFAGQLAAHAEPDEPGTAADAEDHHQVDAQS